MRIQLIFEPASAEEFLRLGRLAEELGFDAVWTANHPAARDPFLTFSLLARESSAIRAGPIAISPFELHPLKMANSLLTLNEFARGRASIVVGGGGGTTIAMRLKPSRDAMLPAMVQGVRESIEFLRLAASGQRIDYRGQVFEVQGYHADWAAQQPPPLLYVGATRARMLRMAVQVADGVMFSDLTAGRLNETMQLIADTLPERMVAGRPRLNNLFAWHVKADREQAAAEARRKLWVRGMVGRWYIEPFLEAAEVALVENNMAGIIRAYVNNRPDIDDLPASLVGKLVEELTFCGDHGDIERIVERCLQFKAAGIDELALRLYDDPEASIRLIAATLGPAL